MPGGGLLSTLTLNDTRADRSPRIFVVSAVVEKYVLSLPPRYAPPSSLKTVAGLMFQSSKVPNRADVSFLAPLRDEIRLPPGGADGTPRQFTSGPVRIE